jgi:hypothetical protein
MIEPTDAAHIHPATPGDMCSVPCAHSGRPIVKHP